MTQTVAGLLSSAQDHDREAARLSREARRVRGLAAAVRVLGNDDAAYQDADASRLEESAATHRGRALRDRRLANEALFA